ncbi:DUF6932 family protein [Actinomadura hibisca]|uniref:DUF6932 family protein n=1 Tax=Actinomadura hibisca TaxID=68565 RepID=UPI0009FC6555|nr:hypothetical protein [Actinomadura hibisca]
MTRSSAAGPPDLVNGQIPPGRWVCSVEQAETAYIKGQSGDREEIWGQWLRLTAALQKVLGEIPACWLSGSLFTDKADPNDIDCLYIVDTAKYNEALGGDPKVAQLVNAATEGRVKDLYGLRIDSYILEWMPTPGPVPTAETRQYLWKRGYWDDLWSRIRSDDPRLDSIPRRGYLEVIIDGYR